MKNDLQKYLDGIKNQVFLSKEHKQQFFLQMQERISEYSEELGHPPSYDELVLKFGSPYEIMESSFSVSSQDDIKKHSGFSKRLKIIVIVIFAIIILTLLALFIYNAIVSYNLSHGYIVSYPVEEVPLWLEEEMEKETIIPRVY